MTYTLQYNFNNYNKWLWEYFITLKAIIRCTRSVNCTTAFSKSVL